MLYNTQAPNICPQGSFVQVSTLKSFSSDPWLLVCQLSTSATINVNLTRAASQPPSNLLLLGKQVCQNFAWNTQALKGSRNLFWLFRVYVLNLLKSIVKTSKQGLGLNKLLLYLDESPYIVFTFKIDAQRQLHYLFTDATNIWVSLRARLQYYCEELKRWLVLNIF